MQRKYQLLGAFLLAIGLFFLADSRINITGAVIGLPLSATLKSVFGMAFMISAIIAFLASIDKIVAQNEDGSIKINCTDKFKKEIKKHSLEEVNKALSKIGTGKGKEERLHGYNNLYSIRESKGGRIIFSYKNPKEVEVDEFYPAHQYSRLKNRH